MSFNNMENALKYWDELNTDSSTGLISANVSCDDIAKIPGYFLINNDFLNRPVTTAKQRNTEDFSNERKEIENKLVDDIIKNSRRKEERIKELTNCLFNVTKHTKDQTILNIILEEVKKPNPIDLSITVYRIDRLMNLVHAYKKEEPNTKDHDLYACLRGSCPEKVAIPGTLCGQCMKQKHSLDVVMK
jgi:hypothetical protein